MTDVFEPTMMRIGDVEVVEPTERIPIGQYVLISAGFGVQFPAIPFGKRGVTLRSAMKEMLDALNVVSNGADGAVGDTEKLSAMDPAEREASIATLSATLDAARSLMDEKVEAFYSTGLRYNYDAKTADWILEKLPITSNTLPKLIQVAQGEDVDTDSFRR
jgi:hypothetical protein